MFMDMPSQMNCKTSPVRCSLRHLHTHGLAGASQRLHRTLASWAAREMGPDHSSTSNTTTGAYVRLGQREFGSADDVLLPHAILLCAIRANHHLHLLQCRVATATAEQPPSLLWPGIHVARFSA